MTGNLTLDALFGARVHWAGDAPMEELDALAAEIASTIDGAVVLPLGGTNALGARAYVEAAHEIAEDAPDARHVVCAVGSGGTWAGLIAGLGAERVLGVDAGAVPDPVARVTRLVHELGADAAALRFRADQVGAGYGAPTDAMRRALDDAARCEGIVLDPVYSGKAMAGLRAAIEDGDIRPGEQTVFVHTGGLPGLFGSPVAGELAARTADGRSSVPARRD